MKLKVISLVEVFRDVSFLVALFCLNCFEFFHFFFFEFECLSCLVIDFVFILCRELCDAGFCEGSEDEHNS